MNKRVLFKLLPFLIIPFLLLIACSNSDVVIVKPTADVPNVTSTGYACPEPEFPAEVNSTELNLFVQTEYIPAEMIECFELIYNVNVNHDGYSNDEAMIESVSAGGSNYDLVQPTDYIVELMRRQGLLQELDHAKLPVLKNFNQNYLDFDFDPGNKYTIPYLIGADGIVVNAGAVENIPESWADLWNPEYAGRMMFLDDSRAVIGITLLVLGYDVNTTDTAQLEEARKKMLELIPNIKLFDSDNPQTAFLAGAVDLGMTWTGEAYIIQQVNPDIEFVYPSEGAILWQDNWAIPKDAAHLDAAYAWLNYINQGNVFWMVLRDFPYTNPNQAALDFAKDNRMEVMNVNGSQTTLAAIYDAYMSSPFTNIPASAIKNGHRITDVGEFTRLYNKIWVEVKSGP